MEQGSVKNYGVKGDGLHDDTEGIQLALDKNDKIYLPKGVYLVRHLIVADNKTIVTDGFETVL
jgi:polygalacturonase